MPRPSSSNTTTSSQSSLLARTPSECPSSSKAPEPTIDSTHIASNNKANYTEKIISCENKVQNGHDDNVLTTNSTRTTAQLTKHSQSNLLAQSDAPTSNKANNKKNNRINNLYNKTTIPLSPTALSEPLSFAEFRNLLNKIIHDAELYEQYTTKTFVVPCKLNSKQSCNGTKFNVEKRKNYKKSKGKSKSKSDKVC